jgi:hypothetical protein
MTRKGHIMQCANPKCRQDSQDLQDGVIRFLEMEVPPEERVVGSEWGFPVFSVATRYFWLCGVCSRILHIARWTQGGLILEPILRRDGPDASVQKIIVRPRKEMLRASLQPACDRVA